MAGFIIQFSSCKPNLEHLLRRLTRLKWLSVDTVEDNGVFESKNLNLNFKEIHSIEVGSTRARKWCRCHGASFPMHDDPSG